MNQLSEAKRVQVLNSLVNGNSIRATVRMTGIAKNTIVKLLLEVGEACEAYQDKTIRNLKKCHRVQCDEIWSFCYAKQGNVPDELKGKSGIGDVWTWTALCADTKLMISYAVGDRNADYARMFMADLASRVSCRIQLTTDGLTTYLEAVEDAFGADIDYAMLIKKYGEQPKEERRKYSPAGYRGSVKTPITGHPDMDHVSTSLVERQNLTMRMEMRRYTRLTNAFSKKIDNHRAAVALHFLWYNFGRVHQTLRCTPAMEAEITDRVWEMKEVVALLDA